MGVLDELQELANAHGFQLFKSEPGGLVRVEAKPIAGGRLRHPIVGYGPTIEVAAGKVLAEIQALPV